MEKFNIWLEHKDPIKVPDSIPVQDKEKNAEGGFDPESKKEVKIYKHADLITLPVGVEGTNCGNCEYIKNMKKGVGFCTHKEIQQHVTARQCCKYWDHGKVKRSWT